MDLNSNKKEFAKRQQNSFDAACNWGATKKLLQQTPNLFAVSGRFLTKVANSIELSG